MKGSSSSASSAANLSFLFAIYEIEPSYDKHGPRYTGGASSSLWLPPNRKSDYRPKPLDVLDVPLYRWANGGIVQEINKSTYPGASELNTRSSCPWTYRTNTVFVQQNNASILAVDFDARRKDVRDSDIAEWREIGFHHLHGQTSVYSYLDVPGEHAHLASGPPPQATNPTWINQLFPQQYHWSLNVDASYPNHRHVGLIGRLPLIISLAAFSCQPFQVRHVLTNCIRPGRWAFHGANHHRASTLSKKTLEKILKLIDNRGEGARSCSHCMARP